MADHQLFLVPPAAHLCQVCAREHPADQPHDATTLFYGMRFRLEHGRDPTWADALAHCAEPVRTAWTAGLATKGIDVNSTAVLGERRSRP